MVWLHGMHCGLIGPKDLKTMQWRPGVALRRGLWELGDRSVDIVSLFFFVFLAVGLEL